MMRVRVTLELDCLDSPTLNYVAQIVQQCVSADIHKHLAGLDIVRNRITCIRLLSDDTNR